ncbi:unnamed protein product [Thelazia callipaeda]|uniref:Uncharacterized protein n=1 Tax=Thelazia callipaeda TaxID=103827 RepID=A0A0N5DBG3_THECL|nr:unnamed protein product [Thelazia callipaeda]
MKKSTIIILLECFLIFPTLSLFSFNCCPVVKIPSLFCTPCDNSPAPSISSIIAPQPPPPPLTNVQPISQHYPIYTSPTGQAYQIVPAASQFSYSQDPSQQQGHFVYPQQGHPVYQQEGHPVYPQQGLPIYTPQEQSMPNSVSQIRQAAFSSQQQELPQTTQDLLKEVKEPFQAKVEAPQQTLCKTQEQQITVQLAKSNADFGNEIMDNILSEKVYGKSHEREILVKIGFDKFTL